MTTRRFIPLCLALAGLVLCHSLIAAQTVSRPIFAYRSGDIWAIDLNSQTATQLTRSGYNGGPILSPDGRMFAYLSVAKDFIDQYEAGANSQTSGSAPANLWIIEVAKRSVTLVADQSGAGSAGVLRSLPSWSPDSRYLVWLELDPARQPTTAAELKLYDVITRATTTLVALVDLGFQGSDIYMPSLRWGEGGIARLHFFYPAGSENPALFLQFYDPVTGAMTQYDLGLNPNRDNTVRDFVWVDHLGESQVALQIKNYWDLIDPEDGTRRRLTNPPRLKTRQLAGALQLIPRSVADGSGNWYIHWHATDGAAEYDLGYKSHRVNRNNRPALSSDGARVAWQSADRVSAWQVGAGVGGHTLVELASSWGFPVPQPFGLVWAPTEWVTTGSLETAQAGPALPPAAPTCDQTPLLSAGQQAIVAPGPGNRVRNAASLAADAIGSLSAGAVVNLEAGPICADGFNWYFARNAQIAGWTAEGSAGIRWLLYHVDCANSPPIRLTAQMRGRVSAGSTLGVRNGKGSVGTAVIGIARAGDFFTITGWPECDLTGERWYPIHFGGLLGWIAAGSGNYYWIEPAP